MGKKLVPFVLLAVIFFLAASSWASDSEVRDELETIVEGKLIKITENNKYPSNSPVQWVNLIFLIDGKEKTFILECEMDGDYQIIRIELILSPPAPVRGKKPRDIRYRFGRPVLVKARDKDIRCARACLNTCGPNNYDCWLMCYLTCTILQ